MLDRYDEEGSDGGWFHSEEVVSESDHMAIPVGVDEIHTIFKCDFCFIDVDKPWVVPARTFAITPANLSQGDWAACELCARLILRNDWNGLSRRSVNAVLRETPEAEQLDSADIEASMKYLHRMLRKNIIGVPKLKVSCD